MSIFIFLFGLAVGSFLNVVINRLESGENIISKPSYCPHCKTKLQWFELIPVLSFVIQKGKCRTCKNRISSQYPLVELITGIIFVFLALKSQNIVNLIYWLFIASALIVIFVYDLKYYIIPNKIIYPTILVALTFVIWGLIRNLDLEIRNLQSLFAEFGLSMVGALFFLLLVLLSKEEWMGMGDVKLAVLMGLILGWPKILPALFLAFVAGALVGLFLITLGKKTLKSQLSFGPFLILGTFVSLFWGNQLINWYLNLNLFSPFF